MAGEQTKADSFTTPLPNTVNQDDTSDILEKIAMQNFTPPSVSSTLGSTTILKQTLITPIDEIN